MIRTLFVFLSNIKLVPAFHLHLNAKQIISSAYKTLVIEFIKNRRSGGVLNKTSITSHAYFNTPPPLVFVHGVRFQLIKKQYILLILQSFYARTSILLHIWLSYNNNQSFHNNDIHRECLLLWGQTLSKQMLLHFSNL